MAAIVRCKFMCVEVAPQPVPDGDATVYLVKFEVVKDGSPENQEYVKITPGGTLILMTYRESWKSPVLRWAPSVITQLSKPGLLTISNLKKEFTPSMEIPKPKSL